MGRQVALRRGAGSVKKLRCSCGATIIVPRNLAGKVRCPGCKAVSRASQIAQPEKTKK